MDSATAVISSVGTYLRGLRARRGISVEEIGRSTRVATRYLEALEADAHDALPAPVFTRGFIRAYCQAVGQSPDEALALYDARDGRPLPVVQPAVAPPTRSTEKDKRARGAVLVSLVLVLVLGVALFAVALVIQPRERAERIVAEPQPEATPAPPPMVITPPVSTAPAAPAAPAIAATPPAPTRAPAAPLASPTPADSAPRPTPPLPVASVQPVAPPAVVPTPDLAGLAGLHSPYRLVARASEATWVRVRTDDGRNSEESIPAGEVREWVSNRPFILTVGNAGGVTFELNGRPLPTLGARGTVIQRLVLPPEAR